MPSMKALEASAGTSADAPSCPRVQTVAVHGSHVPVNWLVKSHDSSKYPEHTIVTPRQCRQTNRDLKWAQKREHVFAVAAAGVHLAMFSYNLAFWGSEGTPPDRYWPDTTRIKLGIRPGRYGNVEGAKRMLPLVTPVIYFKD
eukprot:gene16477-22699_t